MYVFLTFLLFYSDVEEDYGIDTRGTPVGTEEDSNIDLPKPVPAKGGEKESLTLLTPGIVNNPDTWCWHE